MEIPLKIGDVVSIKGVVEGTLEGEGILDTDLMMCEPAGSVDNCLFQLCVRTRVTAAEEFAELEEKHSKNAQLRSDENSKMQLQTLKRVKDKEVEMNYKTMQDKMGQTIHYGEVVQLLHLRSQKFLTVSKTDVAKVEPENFQIGLAKDASTLSWFTLKTSAAFHSESDPVVDGSEVVFCVTVRDEEFLHVSTRAFSHVDWLKETAMMKKHPNQRILEVNSSLERTKFKMTRFCESLTESANNDPEMVAVRAGDVVSLFDPEYRAYACCGTKAGTEDTNKCFFEKVLGDEATEKRQSSSAGLYVIEMQDEEIGGMVEWNTPIVLRQLNSDRFLSFGKVNQILVTSDNRSSDEVVLEFQPLATTAISDDDMYVYRDQPFFLRHRNKFIKSADGASPSVIETEDDDAVPTDAKPLILEVTADSDLLVDVRFGNCARPRLEVFAEELKRLTIDPLALLEHHVHFEAKVDAVANLTDAIHQFTVIDNEAQASGKAGGDNVQCVPHKQRLLQEQGILDQIVDIVEDALVIKNALQNDKEDHKSEKDFHRENIASIVIKTVDVLCERCFNALRVALTQCPANQIYLGDRFPVLLSFVGSGSAQSVMGCITQMLDNIEIQQERVNEAEINLFIEMLRKSPMSAPILNVFTVMCTCNGVAVEDNQCLLSEKLLQENSDMLVQFQSGNSNNIEFKIPGAGTLTAKQMSGGKNAKQVAFLSGQLYLLADMCYDRNYIAIREIEKQMSIDVVVNCIQSDDLPAQLRSAFVRLVTHLYVDRMPQQRDRIRNLTFPWSKVGSSTALSMAVTGSYAGAFKDLQSTIAEHVAGNQWTSFTEHLVGLLLKLLQFKFYNDKAPDVCAVLEDICKRITEEVDDKNDSVTSSSKSRKAARQTVVAKPTAQRGSKRGGQGSKYQPGKIIPTDSDDFVDGEPEDDAPTIGDKLFPIAPRKAVLKVINSFQCISFMVGLTVVALVIDFMPGDTWTEQYNINADTGAKEYLIPLPLFIWDKLVFCVFAIELILRLWAMCDMPAFVRDIFCVMDFLVVCLDLIVIFAATIFQGINPKILRIVRVFRLTKLAKVMRLMKKLRDEMNRKKDVPPWTLARKFKQSPKEKLLAMTQMVHVLHQTMQMEQRYKLAGILGAIKGACQTQEQIAEEKFHEGFMDTALANSGTLKWGSDFNSKDNMLLHLILYEYPDLVQVSLSTLMLLHSGRSALMDDVKETQLLTNPEEESLYEQLEAKIDKLTAELESFELWGTLESDADIAKGHSVKSTLSELTALCRSEGETFATGGAKFDPNPSAQVMLRNLEAMQAYLQWRDAVPYPAPEANNAEAILSREIRLLANQFLKWWIQGNSQNQDIAFDYLETVFIDDLQLSNVAGCAAVMRAILHGNERLIKLIPPQFVDVLCNYLRSNHDPDALGLLGGLTRVGTTPVKENQIKVMILLTHPSYKTDVLYLCNGKGTADYEERRSLMAEVKNKIKSSTALVSGPSVPLAGPSVTAMQDPMAYDSSLGHLPRPLQYHIRLLDLLSACAAGGINIVEAKVQNLYPYVLLLNDLNHSDTCLDVKIALAKLFFEAVVEVQVPVEGLCSDQHLWEWFLTFPVVLDDAVVILGQISNGIHLPGATAAQQLKCRHTMSYVFECILPSITHFFNVYYDEDQCPPGAEIRDLPSVLALKVSNFHKAAKACGIPQAVVSLETASRMKMFGRGIKDYVQVESPKTKHRRISTVGDGLAEGADVIYDVQAITEEAKVVLKTDLEQSLERRIAALSQADDVLEGAKHDMDSLLQFLKDLKRLADKVENVHLRLEPLLAKLVQHVLSYVQVQGDRKSLDANKTQTTVWTINLFRKMIEYDWKFTVEERDDEGDDDSDENVRWVQDALDDAGATGMCLDLISKGLTIEVKDEAILLLMAMLFQEGGNQKVQTTIFKHLSSSATSEFFFIEARDTLQRISHYHQSNPDAEEPPPGILLLKALQLSCEGHFLKNQDIAREQPNNEVQVNLLKTLVSTLKDVSKVNGACARGTILAVLELILEDLQGPCKGNQEDLCHQTDLLETMNRMMRDKAEDDPAFAGATEEEQEEIQEEIDEMKTCILCIFKALLEGQGNGQPSAIYRRVLSVLHLEVLQFLLNPPKLEMDADLDADDLDAQMEEQERLDKMPLSELQVQSLVLIKMLTGYNPDLQDELTLSESVQAKMGTEVISIEVVWNDNLEKRYFHVPEITNRHLSKSTMDNLVENVERENQDLKLTDFVERAKKIMEELQHQEVLRGVGLARLFSRENQFFVTWVTFIINLGINIMYLFNLSYVNDDSNALNEDAGFQKHAKDGLYSRIDEPGTWKNSYQLDDDASHEDWLAATTGAEGLSHDMKTPQKCISSWRAMECYNLGDPDLDTLMFALNWSQILFSVFTLILFLVVRAPISFKLCRSDGGSVFDGFVAMFTQDATSYYIMYVAFAVLGKEVSPLYNTLLLLDILMKLSTARDVLLAVWIPIKPLLATLVLGAFIIYIFTFCIFTLNEIRFQGEFLKGECDYLIKCFQWAAGFGMRNGGGHADYFNGVSRYRLHISYVLDILFFIVIIIVIMSIIFGIIIDTFGSLREEKKERQEDTTEVCFICGMDKSDFDQLGGRVWQKHIKEEHNMWAYLKFMVFLWLQDQDDDDGLEQYVRGCLDNNDLRWYPHNKAMRLDEDARGGDDEDSGLLDAIADLQKQMAVELGKVQAHTNDQYKSIMDEIAKIQEATAGIESPKLDPLVAGAAGK